MVLNEKMKKEHQTPKSVIVLLEIGYVLTDTSSDPIPIGEGDGDSRRSGNGWGDED